MSEHDTSPSTVDAVDLQMAFKLTPALAELLMLLLTKKLVTLKEAEAVYKGCKTAVYRLRQRLNLPDLHDITVCRNVGYWIDPETKKFILDRVRARFGEQDPRQAPSAVDASNDIAASEKDDLLPGSKEFASV